MENPERSGVLLDRLRSEGVQLSIDDFGTGYSSLAYLKRLPLDALKIDQSFVHGLPGDWADAAIVRAIVAMAQNLDLNVIAEGVETEAQAEFLRAIGCRAAQGYHFGKPALAAELAEVVRRLATVATDMVAEEALSRPRPVQRLLFTPDAAEPAAPEPAAAVARR